MKLTDLQEVAPNASTIMQTRAEHRIRQLSQLPSSSLSLLAHLQTDWHAAYDAVTTGTVRFYWHHVGAFNYIALRVPVKNNQAAIMKVRGWPNWTNNDLIKVLEENMQIPPGTLIDLQSPYDMENLPHPTDDGSTELVSMQVADMVRNLLGPHVMQMMISGSKNYQFFGLKLKALAKPKADH
jgi:hypothetical protein